MINRTLLNRFKVYKVSSYGEENVIKIFPSTFANILTMLYIKLTADVVVNFRFEKKIYDKFVTDLQTAIINEHFDYFDNIILELLHNYHFRYKEYIISLDFNDLKMEEFIVICNEFSGKKWDDILDTFIDAFYDLLCTATANDIQVNL
jgi:hypothetical protein